MPFLELSIACKASEEARVETALNELGALSVSLLDAADAENEKAILEPGVGETPLWNDIVLLALFDAGTHEGLLLHALDAYDSGIDWSSATFRTVEDQDWERAWLDQFEPMRFGSRTWIIPWHRDAKEQDVCSASRSHSLPRRSLPCSARCIELVSRQDSRCFLRRTGFLARTS